MEYYRTLSSGLPGQIFQTAMFTSTRYETAPKRLGTLPEKAVKAKAKVVAAAKKGKPRK